MHIHTRLDNAKVHPGQFLILRPRRILDTSCCKFANNRITQSTMDLVNASAVADPGFPVGGGVDLVGGGVDSRGGYVSKILYVKMKELGTLGGGGVCWARPPRSANEVGGENAMLYTMCIKRTFQIVSSIHSKESSQVTWPCHMINICPYKHSITHPKIPKKAQNSLF